MNPDVTIRRYRRAYSLLLRLYPRRHRERCAEGMEQTFAALLRERAATGRPLFTAALWLALDALGGLLREQLTVILMHKKIVRVAFATACLLLVPFVAMQLGADVHWTAADFAVAGALLFGAGLAYVGITARNANRAYRGGAALALLTAMLLAWINLAVGIIGAENDRGNLLFFGVIAIGVVGACLARFRARGMARALILTAMAQALVPACALALGSPAFESAHGARAIATVCLLSAFFAALFGAAAWLFRRAAAPSHATSQAAA
jgi:hypothetical protein